MKVIELEGVGKRYWQLEEQAMLLKSLLPFTRPLRHELWALRDVDLTINAGETIGILGRNGAGKTTLLRLLAGVTQPSQGRVTTRGRIAPLISVGVGFHPEMSGRENVYVNGMLLGLTKAEVEERFEDIVAFAELSDFIDTPVKFYSSGMFMRLGFSVAVHTEPQILLIDEVLAVGDTPFQLKCFDQMRRLHEGGAAIVFVSHSVNAIRLLCPRAAVFQKGRLEFDGPVEEAINGYHGQFGARSDDARTHLHERTPRGAVTILSQELLDVDGSPTAVGHQEAPVVLRAELRFEEDVHTPQFFFVAHAEDGSFAYGTQSAVGQGDRPCVAGQHALIEVLFTPRFGGGGTYALELYVTDRNAGDVLGRSTTRTLLYVTPRPGTWGFADLTARIRLDGHFVDDHPSYTLGPPMTGPSGAAGDFA